MKQFLCSKSKPLLFLTALICTAHYGISTSANQLERNASGVAEGTYTVPVTDPSLSPYATFSVKVSLKTRRDQTLIKYDLPLEITGEHHEIKIMGSLSHNSTFKMDGPMANALCSEQNQKIICRMQYPKELVKDPVIAESYLKGQNYPETELNNRLSVVRVFSNEPIGILNISIK